MADDTGEIGREAAEAVGFRDIKETEVTSGGPAYWTNLAMAHAVNQQAQMYQIGNAITGKVAEMIMATSPAEGGSDIATMMTFARMLVSTPSPGPGAAPAGAAEKAAA